MQERKYCWQCGTVNQIYAKFCSSCGAAFEEGELLQADTARSIPDNPHEREDTQDLKSIPAKPGIVDKNEASSQQKLAPHGKQRLVRDVERHVAKMGQPQDSQMVIENNRKNQQSELTQDTHHGIAIWKAACIAVASVVVISGIIFLLYCMLNQSDQPANSSMNSLSSENSSTGADVSASQSQTDRRSPKIAGLYCRNNGACISISKTGNILLTESDSTLINESSRSTDYPFSSYLQGITLADTGQEESESGQHVMEFIMKADGSISCASGTATSMPSCDAPDGSYMFLNVAFYYVPRGTNITQMQSQIGASIDGDEPDTAKPYLVFQKEAGTNAPFDASDDAVFYFIE